MLGICGECLLLAAGALTRGHAIVQLVDSLSGYVQLQLLTKQGLQLVLLCNVLPGDQMSGVILMPISLTKSRH
jgi:hypothetical protein